MKKAENFDSKYNIIENESMDDWLKRLKKIDKSKGEFVKNKNTRTVKFKEYHDTKSEPADPRYFKKEDESDDEWLERLRKLEKEGKTIIGDNMKKVAEFRLTPRAKQVIMSFIEQRPDSCKYLQTDGKVLNGRWMGGKRVAYWKGDKIIFGMPSGKSAQTIIHAIEKLAPTSKMAGIQGPKMNKYQKVLADFLEEEHDLAEQEMSLDTAPEENIPEEDKSLDLDASIISFFKENKSPKDDEVHAYAESLGVDPHTFETAIYNMLSDFINKAEEAPSADDLEGCGDTKGCSESGGCGDSKYAKVLDEFLGEGKNKKRFVKKINKTADKKWTLSEVKNALEDAGSHFFSRKTLKFFGQSMRDFGVANVASRVFIYSKRPNKSGTITFHEFLPSESRTRPLGKAFKHIDDVKDYLRGLKKGGGKEEQGCSESDGCGDSKYAKVLDSFLKEAEVQLFEILLYNIEWEISEQEEKELDLPLPNKVFIKVKADSKDEAVSKAVEEASDQYSYLISATKSKVMSVGKPKTNLKEELRNRKESKYAKVLGSFLKEADGPIGWGFNSLADKKDRAIRNKDIQTSKSVKLQLKKEFPHYSVEDITKIIKTHKKDLGDDAQKLKKRYVEIMSADEAVQKESKYAKVLVEFLGEKVAITNEHFILHIKWPKEFGEYGKSKVTDADIDEYVNKLIGKTVESIKYPGLSLEIGATIPGRTKNGTPLLSVNIYYNKKPGSNLPKDWSNKFINKLKEIKNIIRIK